MRLRVSICFLHREPTLTLAALAIPLPIALTPIPAPTPRPREGDTPRPGPTLLARVPADLVPAATEETGGRVLDAANGLAAAVVGRVRVVVVLELDPTEPLLLRAAVLRVRVEEVEVGRESVVDGFLVVVGLKPADGFRTVLVLSLREEPETCRLATGIAGDEGTLRLLALIEVERGMAEALARVDGRGSRDVAGG